MNPRQVKQLDRLLDGFEGKSGTSNWVAIAERDGDRVGPSRPLFIYQNWYQGRGSPTGLPARYLLLGKFFLRTRRLSSRSSVRPIFS